jgi:diadenosine tetraphosphate (Ap4A) HIT family hydrolase
MDIVDSISEMEHLNGHQIFFGTKYVNIVYQDGSIATYLRDDPKRPGKVYVVP